MNPYKPPRTVRGDESSAGGKATRPSYRYVAIFLLFLIFGIGVFTGVSRDPTNWYLVLTNTLGAILVGWSLWSHQHIKAAQKRNEQNL